LKARSRRAGDFQEEPELGPVDRNYYVRAVQQALNATNTFTVTTAGTGTAITANPIIYTTGTGNII
jgi:hypothetical protein